MNKQKNNVISKAGRFIEGKKIYLRDITIQDVEGGYAQWLNDQEVCRFNSHGRYPISKKELKMYVRSAKASSDKIVFAIVDKISNLHIGNIALQDINKIDRTAEIAIVIGEKEYWGKGIGLMAWKLVMAYGFDILNLHRLHCGMIKENTGMVKIAERSGMKKEGIRREAFYREGKYQDIVEFGILKNEYESAKKSTKEP